MLILTFMFLLASAHAQNFTGDISAIGDKVSEGEIESYVASPGSEGVPGTHLQNLFPTPSVNPETMCEEDGEKKNSKMEVVVAVEVNPRMHTLEILPRQLVNYYSYELNYLNMMTPPKDGESLTEASVIERARDYWTKSSHGHSGPFDVKSSMGRELFMESLVSVSSRSSLSEVDLSRSMARIIGEVYTTKQERLDLLNALSIRMYRNYNSARNPGYNNSFHNPNQVPLPPGDLSLNDMLSAATRFDEFGGGVCNDISEVVAMVGQELFPDHDVLAVNSGSHFGVVVTDGKEHRIIDGGSQLSMTNQLLLTPEMSPSNLRISKMVDGGMKEIAVVDTQMGQVTEAAFQTGKNLLKTDTDISSLMASLKKNNFGVTAGVAQLNDSQVVIVVAKYENAGERWKSYFGTGVSAQKFQSGGFEDRYQVHLRAGLEHQNLRFVNARSSLSFATGVRMGGMYALNNGVAAEGVNAIDMSMSLDLYNRLDYTRVPLSPNGVKVNASLEVEHTLGPKNWGHLTGTLSKVSGSDIGPVLRNMSFHLNQVNARVGVAKPLSKNLTAVGNAHYQGSNIGQMLNAQLGVQVRAPAGAQILFFTGYTNSRLPGYQTQHSLLGTPSGVQFGANVKTKKGAQFGGSMGTGPSGKTFNATIKIPLSKP